MKMDKTYIMENGILEQYILGELNTEDRIQVENILKLDDELAQQLRSFEESFEALAQENAVQPPSFLKEQLLKSVSKTEGKVIPLKKANNTRFILNIAAGFAGIFLISSIILYSQLNTTKEQLNVVESQKDKLLEDMQGLTENLNYSEKWLGILKNPNVEPYLLKGNTLSPDLKVVSYINHENKSVVISTSNLPKLDKEHDYQMWADVEGEMINMGVIDSSEELVAMQYINDAESLNITIEPAGGNDHPTVSNLVTSVALR